MEIFSSLLIFLAPYGATDSSPAGCGRLAVGSGWRGPEKSGEEKTGWSGKRQQSSSGPACHLYICVCTDRPPLCANTLTHGVNVRLSTADSEMSGGQERGRFELCCPLHPVCQVTQACCTGAEAQCVFVCPVAEGRIHREDVGSFSLLLESRGMDGRVSSWLVID